MPLECLDYALEDFFATTLEDSMFVLGCIRNGDYTFGDCEITFDHIVKSAQEIINSCEKNGVLKKAEIVVQNIGVGIRDLKKIEFLARLSLYYCSAEYAMLKEFHVIKSFSDSLVFQVLSIDKILNTKVINTYNDESLISKMNIADMSGFDLAEFKDCDEDGYDINDDEDEDEDEDEDKEKQLHENYRVTINVLHSFVCVDDEGISNAVIETECSSQKIERHVY